ncbi:MAG: hypothetical protein WD960_09170 [Gemmatimonadota bacterium]
MRNGMTPLDAGMDAVRRIRSNTIQPRLSTDEGERAFGINFYIVNAEGEHAGVTLRGGGRYAVCTENGPELVPFESLL